MLLTEYDKLCESLRYIKGHTDVIPKIGIICGSGLGNLVDLLEKTISIPYSKIPHFPQSTVAGHSGELVIGEHDRIPIICMRGRVHLYEGYDTTECIRPIRLMCMMGIEILCVTNAAGNMNRNNKPGDFMVIKDHISFPTLAGENPLRGPHDPRFGERFVTMSNAYDIDLIDDFINASVKTGLDHCVKTGVYAMVVGPTYETIAEARALKMLGADAMGMSTVNEIVAAHQMGVRCMAVSLLTNEILTDYNEDFMVEHGSIVEMGAKRSEEFIQLIMTFIRSIRIQLKV